MKKIIITIIVSLSVIYLTFLTLFDNTYTYDNISNAFFIVGLFMFLISLVMITDASKIFLMLRYSFSSILAKGSKYKTYFDYAKDRQREGITPYAVQCFIVSIVYIIIAIIFAQLYMASIK